jgi:amidase
LSDIPTLSAVQTAAAIRSKEMSVQDVFDAHIQHLEKVNPAINAVVEVVEESRDLARQMDAAHPGADAPPLWGVPVTVKINVDQAGYANSNGLEALKHNVATDDSPVVANLRAAGALIIGRTNTPELSLRWFTSNPLHGVTRNPRNLALTPGGSSGGAAAAVAAGIGTIGHGNDLGGSLRYPAFCCGVTSIRPSMGRVPAFNPSAKAERPPIASAMAVQGPIARNIADLRLALQAMAQRSVQDPMWTSAVHDRPAAATIKVGYARNLFADVPEDAMITKAMDDALAGLKSAGVETVETAMPHADRAAELWGDLLFAETDLLMGRLIREATSPAFQTMYAGYLEAYRRLDFAGYLAGTGERVGIQRDVARMFEKVDLFMMPTSMARPFENDLDFNAPEKMGAIVAAQKPLHIVNLLGLPAVALPTGIIEGFPVGVQLVGPMHADAFVLDVAERLEKELGTLGVA